MIYIAIFQGQVLSTEVASFMKMMLHSISLSYKNLHLLCEKIHLKGQKLKTDKNLGLPINK